MPATFRERCRIQKLVLDAGAARRYDGSTSLPSELAAARYRPGPHHTALPDSTLNQSKSEFANPRSIQAEILPLQVANILTILTE